VQQSHEIAGKAMFSCPDGINTVSKSRLSATNPNKSLMSEQKKIKPNQKK
jgi:hypothetical protein